MAAYSQQTSLKDFACANGAGRSNMFSQVRPNEMFSMRRAQALLVILALLATPLAIFANAGCCCQTTCPMCAAMQHGKMAHCTCPMNKAKCGTNGKTQLPDFALASPLAPTVPLPFFHIAAPAVSRAASIDAVIAPSYGFLSPPFAPPRS